MAPVTPSPNTAVVGLQWGDEGKGKIIDLLTPGFSAVVRYNGGANAGHSVVFGGQRHALHLVPSGIFHRGVRAVIGNGVVVDPEALLSEIDVLTRAGVDVSGLALSDRAHVVLDYHKAEDALRETLLAAGANDPENTQGDRSIGTTRRGIGPAYSDKAQRASAVRIRDLLEPDRLHRMLRETCAFKNRLFATLGAGVEPINAESIADRAAACGERLRPHVTDTVVLLHQHLREGKPLLFEGANATLLDVDHGTFPFVTSSNCSVLGIPSGTGVPGRRIERVIGVMKAYSTRVGGGPFPTEQDNPTGARIRERGREFGTTTGRPRRCGWIDLAALRYSVMINGCDEAALMLLDVLAGFDELRVCTGYRVGGRVTDQFTPDAEWLRGAEPIYETLPGFAAEVGAIRRRADLPDGAKRYVDFIERALSLPVTTISVGPDREQTIR